MKKTEDTAQTRKDEDALQGRQNLTPEQKARRIRKTVKKRRRQFRHLMTALQVAIRILNAAGRRTVYRK